MKLNIQMSYFTNVLTPEITDQISYKNLLESGHKLDVSFHKCTEKQIENPTY